MIEIGVFALAISLVLCGATTFGVWLGYTLCSKSIAPKWYKPPVATERAQAIKERSGEDKYLKQFMDAYSKGLFMTADDYNSDDKSQPRFKARVQPGAGKEEL